MSLQRCEGCQISNKMELFFNFINMDAGYGLVLLACFRSAIYCYSGVYCRAYWFTAVGCIILQTLSVLIGISIFSYFKYCNPLETGEIFTKDQVGLVAQGDRVFSIHVQCTLIILNFNNSKFLLIQTPSHGPSSANQQCTCYFEIVSPYSNICLLHVQVQATSNQSLQLNFDEWYPFNLKDVTH